MTILSQLINFMLKKTEVKPTPKSELDNFLLENNIEISDDYYQFLLNYGNSDFLTSDFADLRFLELQDYYSYDRHSDGITLPNGYHYVGMDFNDVLLCKSADDAPIYTFGYGQTDKTPYYGNIASLLFFSLLKSSYQYRYFDDITLNQKITDTQAFQSAYLAYEIKDIYIYDRYFFKDNQLIVCDDKFNNYHTYQGGILNHIIDDRA